jgi:hypothetical protein
MDDIYDYYEPVNRGTRDDACPQFLYEDAYKNAKQSRVPDFNQAPRYEQTLPPREVDRPTYNYTSPEGRVHELKGLRYRTADHEGADALVYVPPGFDPTKPVKVVLYNHGLRTDVSEAFRNSQLKEQLDKADPNTILIMPEWQARPQTNSHASGNFQKEGFVRSMLQEVMDKTPELAGKKVDDIQSFSVFTHSGGYNAAASEIYKNGLGGKVDNLTLLDSLYDGKLFDGWIRSNIRDLATGRKHFNNFFGSSTSTNSAAEATRVEGMLRDAGFPKTAMAKDFNGRTIMSADEIQSRGIVFKRSDVNVRNRGAHSSVTNIYPQLVLQDYRSGTIVASGY